jgi:2-polyprenyl-3-methyl-5-hydroxy-6-metoxy-1,4-benzoquinol methylase
VRRYARVLPAVRRTWTPGREPRVSDAAGDAAIVLVHADLEAYLLPETARRLIAGLAAHAELALLLPVTNEPIDASEETRAVPPFLYTTPTLLAEAVAAVEAASSAAGDPLRPAEGSASPVFAVRREVLRGMPGDLPLRRVPAEARARGLRAAVDPGAYLHRYGAMDASAREDLAAKIPDGAASVLDVGCSQGATAPALRARGVSRIVGIEPDAGDAAQAARVYDRVVSAPLEGVSEDWNGAFDAILFGDVLEHLEDPSDALARVRPWLTARGVVIASVPNAGHWSIVDDLLRGRFDYVPYSLLSGTHVRLFTRRTLSDLFEASGYRVEELSATILPASPRGLPRLERLRTLPGASSDLEVSEFLAVARADEAAGERR